MKPHALLALDTSTSFCSVALLRVAPDDASRASGASMLQRLFVRHRDTGPESSTYVLTAVREVLADAGLALSDCVAIAYGRGPGSFTGLRTAVGVVQGLAFGAGLPVIGVDSLLACAERARLARLGIVLPCEAGAVEIGGENAATASACERTLVAVDARMDEAYWAAYAHEAEGWRTLAAPAVGPPEAVGRGVLGADGADGAAAATFALAGNAAAVFGARLGGDMVAAGLLGSVAAADLDAMPHAGAIARLAHRVWLAGGAQDAASAAPEYVRDKVALTIDERAARRAETAR
ncbi:tRNA (adenosine(37)-N6)-threonylcarbamoyltransferase complex dimerization subunit type 1 TsaB [Chitinasiproducens palmae]|uniref:tRNA threonylcarbamoyladenosine biosynthesis protein TsaB n=1 Tax=Chitinasiproducens palmae TaxID=1770053 RepID=A0A1H2PLX4_9BURK|nr:tRNA (adenosine(37)-N6)-threonylcarbamoyltransferase complex dimerization subunit type 1 TsaB [Chitinasiproducens palmae]SDV47516.1 tRNA threonylcarbamoyladenosine biosynthesis protein TsaB [Chitinasiproducens palmae]